MEPDNVELVRSLFDAYQRGDLEEVLANVAPEVVWNPFEEEPMRGPDAIRAYFGRWEDEWDELVTIPEDFVAAGDRVFVTVRFRGRGRGSGIEVEARTYHVYTVRDGKTVRMDEFTERAEAVEAAGLDE